MAKFIVAIETVKIKEFLFSTNKLKVIRGASYLLDYLNQVEVPKILKDKNIYFLLATLDNEAIGLIWLSFNEKLSKYEYQRKQIWIEGIYVRAEYRRKGIAKKLVNEAINKAKFLNAQSIELMIWDFNETSKKFFENYFKVRSLILKKEL